MKNTKKSTIVIGAIAILLGVMLMPCINAMILEEKTVKMTTKGNPVNEEYMSEETGKDMGSTDCGSIYGYVCYTRGWAIFNLPFVIVDAEYGKDRTNFMAYYQIDNLPVGQTFKVTVDVPGFEKHTELVELSQEEPNLKLDIELEATKSNYQFSQQSTTPLFFQILQKLMNTS